MNYFGAVHKPAERTRLENSRSDKPDTHRLVSLNVDGVAVVFDLQADDAGESLGARRVQSADREEPISIRCYVERSRFIEREAVPVEGLDLGIAVTDAHLCRGISVTY